jgi:hypothetical protein
VFEKFNDGLVVSKLFNTYNLDDVTAERTGNTIWRPQPYIAQSFTGIDQSATSPATTRSSRFRPRLATATRFR